MTDKPLTIEETLDLLGAEDFDVLEIDTDISSLLGLLTTLSVRSRIEKRAVKEHLPIAEEEEP
jgi:hypothetical protein